MHIVPKRRTPIRKIMRAEGRKQTWLAREVGVSEAQISLICNQGYVPPEALRKRIAEALGRSADELWPEAA